MNNITPDTSLPPIGDGPRRRMLISIEVTEDFENRLDNQWMVEREINADRWHWHWEDDLKPNSRIVELCQRIKLLRPIPLVVNVKELHEIVAFVENLPL